MCLLILSVAVSSGQKPAVLPMKICAGERLTFTAASPEATNYQWFRDGIPLTGEVQAALSVTMPGDYEARCYTASGCLSDASQMISVSWKQPLAADDEAYSDGSGITVDVLQNDTSPCSGFDTATLKIEGMPGYGTVVPDGSGGFVYHPLPGFAGADEFTYSVKDADGIVSNIAVVRIKIGSPLPVGVLSFEVRKKEREAVAVWKATGEEGVDSYELQRSTDAHSWSVLATLPARAEGREETAYAWTDRVPEAGVNYYRLRIRDRDGSGSFSKIVSVYFEPDGWISIYPNPSSETVFVRIAGRAIRQMQVTDASGRMLLEVPVRSSLEKIDIRKFPVGMYFIRLQDGEGRVYHFKIMKN